MRSFRLGAAAAAGVCLLFAACAQSAVPAGSGASQAKTASSAVSRTAIASIRLPYAKNKQLNPYLADCQVNLNVWPLLYDALAEPDASFQPKLELASHVQVTGTTMTITPRGDVLFTDGSRMSAADVTYSIQYAMSLPNGSFYSRVSNFAGVSQQGANVVVTLKTPDPLAANLLDFPVFKRDSDKSGLPVGTGRYVYQKDGNNALLKRNDKHYTGKLSPVTSITLVDMPDSDAIVQSLGIDELDYILTDYGTGTSAVTNVESSQINLNQLVFLGVNNANAALSDPHVRRAISALIDRKTFVADYYSSRGVASVLPFHPGASGVQPTAASSLSAQSAAALAELAAAGYTTKNVNNIYEKSQDGVTTTLSFTLLVNSADSQRISAAQKLSDTLKSAGIQLTLKEVSAADYSANLAAGSFDLYFAEVKLPFNLDISALCAPGAAAAYGAPAAGTFYAKFQAWRSGGATLADACAAFADEMPFIPLCFRNGTVSYHANFFKGIVPTAHDLFYNIEDWQ